jgi:hypothetical protein
MAIRPKRRLAQFSIFAARSATFLSTQVKRSPTFSKKPLILSAIF